MLRLFIQRSIFVLGWSGIMGWPALGAADAAFGPLKVGDAVECTFGGWSKGQVTFVDGLTYLVRMDSDPKELYVNLYHLNGVRPIGSDKTYADLFHGTTPDPDGGPVAIGQQVEITDGYHWYPARVSRKIGARYYVFNETKGYSSLKEAWLTLDQLRPLGGEKPFAPAPAAPFKANRPSSGASLHVGDEVEAKWTTGFYAVTLLSIDRGRYYYRAAPDSAIRGWASLAELRPVGGGDRFQQEDLSVFAGRWRLTGDAFFTTRSSRREGQRIIDTKELNSGAGADAGVLVIKNDGTYQLEKTVVFHDGTGRWIPNPDQTEGGILLKSGDSDGKDAVVTARKDDQLYLQHSIRGPGKWCTRLN